MLFGKPSFPAMISRCCRSLYSKGAVAPVRIFGNSFSSVTVAADTTAPAHSTIDSDKKTEARRKSLPRPPKDLKIGITNINDAFETVKKYKWASFDETVEAIINLNVDPRKPNQSIKGVASLPHGTGKKVVIGVFAKDADAQAAINAGADIVGAEDLITRVQLGDIPFQRVIATPEMMPLLAKIGKLLGPKGLMPNPKLGTVTKDVAQAVLKAKAGSVQYRVEKKGIIQAGIGKASFSNEALLENFKSLMISIFDAKPETLKGKYIMGVHVKSTMGPSVPIDVPTADPSNARFMLDASVTLKK